MSLGEGVWTPAGWRPLGEAVTDLALEGNLDAPAEALRRLSAGEWTAQGEWRWVAWLGACFDAERDGLIPRDRWIGLRDGLARGLNAMPGGKPLPTFSNGYTFDRELPHFELAEWSWQYDRFETALVIGPDREEWFSAVSIHVWNAGSPVSRQQAPAVAVVSKGGRPPTWDWEAATLAMAGRFYVGDLKPRTVAEIIRALQEWASSVGEAEMSDAAARPHARRMFDAFRSWEPEA